MATPERVVVVGASGFGREALDVLEAMRAAGAYLAIEGVLDDSPSYDNLERVNSRGIEFLGTIDDWLSRSEVCRFVLAIGDPDIRRKLVRKLEAAGLLAFTAVHPSAIQGSRTRVGEGVVICAGVVISTNVTLGQHVHINPSVTIGHDTILGDFVSINPGAVLSGDVHIRNGVTVGAGATVLQQLTVDESSVIGAGAVLTKSAPSQVIVKGVPGRW